MSGGNGKDPNEALRRIQKRIAKEEARKRKAVERGRRKQARKEEKRRRKSG
jgi:hypothetical protein